MDRLNLTITGGEIYGFLGPNGAGKTTTLRMLTGLVSPTAGSVTVVGDAPGTRRALAGVGALIEGPALYPYLSGRDNLRVLARMCSVGASRVEECLEIVGLSARAKDRFSRYSLGMKQRLGVAAALLKDPRLLILDEPTNGLDPAGMRDMRVLVLGLKEQGYAVLLSSHILDEVEEVCDRVGIIDRGRLVVQGTVAELRGSARLRIRVEPRPRAGSILETLVGAGNVDEADGAFVVPAGLVPTSVITKTLIDDGLQLVGIEQVEHSLEDIFFELTKGDNENAS